MIPMIDINDTGAHTWYHVYRRLVAMIPIPINGITDTNTWCQWYRYRYMISMKPIPDINDTATRYHDTDASYQLSLHMMSMIPLRDLPPMIAKPMPDINATQTGTWSQLHCYVISLIPIRDINNADTDTWQHDSNDTDTKYLCYRTRFMI